MKIIYKSYDDIDFDTEEECREYENENFYRSKLLKLCDACPATYNSDVEFGIIEPSNMFDHLVANSYEFIDLLRKVANKEGL